MRRASLLFALLLVGCPRVASPRDAGTDDASEPDLCSAYARGEPDPSYDPELGNAFEGGLVLDDRRVSELDPEQLLRTASPCLPPHMGRVTYVVDGDTIHVQGSVPEPFEFRVRLIGVDTPETHIDGQPADCCYAREAADFTRQLQGRLVWLTFDQECIDRFDRHLAYVHIGSGVRDMWQRQLLRRGMARVMTIGPNRFFASTFMQDKAVAQEANVGLWCSCGPGESCF